MDIIYLSFWKSINTNTDPTQMVSKYDTFIGVIAENLSLVYLQLKLLGTDRAQHIQAGV